MQDLESRLRPITSEEWPAFLRSMVDVFGHEPSGPYVDQAPPLGEFDRSLALFEGDRIAATSGIFSRELTVPGGAGVPCAAVTWVTVSPTHRRRGVLTAIMRRQLDEVHRSGREPVAALWAAEAPIYGRFGYAPATFRGGITGSTERLRVRPDADLGSGRVDVADADSYRTAAVGLHERLRPVVPGTLARDDRWWDRILHDDRDERPSGASARRYLLHTEADGAVTGYAAYRVKPSWTDGGEPDGTLTVEDVRGMHPAAYAALWRFLLSIDLIRSVRYPMSGVDDPLRYLLHDSRALHSLAVDALWVRLVDVDRALAARRYPTPIDLVLEVRDQFCPWNAGRWRLTGYPAGGHCARTDRDPDLLVDVRALASAYLGGVSLATLQAAGQVTEVSPGAVTLAATAFGWPVTPWCADEF